MRKASKHLVLASRSRSSYYCRDVPHRKQHESADTIATARGGRAINASDLIALATAKGIDLSHVGGNASNTKGAAGRRPRSDLERRLGLEIIETARGRGSRTSVAPIWSHAELGMAARGVPELPWLAARFSFAGDMSCYWKLWFGLLFQAQRLAVRNNWRPQVPNANGEPKFYLEGLSRLVLDEDAHRPFFTAAPALYAVYMDVDDLVWQRLLAARHAMLKARYEIWLGTARGMIQRWISDHDSTAEADTVSPSTRQELRDATACV